MGYSLREAESIKKRLIPDGTDVIIPEDLRNEYPELFKHVDSLYGIVKSIGRHAAGVVVSTNDIDSEMGTLTIKNWNGKITQLVMKPIDKLNYVKLDVLAIDSLELINRTAKFAGLERITPDSDFVDFEDKAVWDDVHNDTSLLFQFESARAGKILSDILSDFTIENVKKKNKDFKYIDLIALASASQRPSGESYVENVQNGIYADNGHDALNELFKDTMGYMVYQEQLSKFLVQFCGWTMAQADLIRRGMSKKEKSIMDNEVPKIKPSFIKTMVEKYGDSQEHAEQVADSFIQVFMDAVNYGFNKSHAIGYAYITGAQAWLRHYYPLEYCTVASDLWKDDLEKTKRVLDFAERKGIKIQQPTFRYSKGGYFFDKPTNTIYQGIAPIKGCNVESGDLLYELRDNQYKYFVDLLMDIRGNEDIILNDKRINIKELYDMSEEDLKAFDKKLSAITKYTDFVPHEDKTIMKRFVKYTQTSNDMTVQDLLQEELMDSSKKHQAFYYWLDNIDTKPQPWRDMEDTCTIEKLSKSDIINKSKIEALIKMDYFREFGEIHKLLEVADYFWSNYKHNVKTYKTKIGSYHKCVMFEQNCNPKPCTTVEKIDMQLELMGRATIADESISSKYVYIVDAEPKSNYARCQMYSINKGQYFEAKIGSRLFKEITLQSGDVIDVTSIDQKAKRRFVRGEWIKDENEKELWIKGYSLLRRRPVEEDKKKVA